MNRPWSNEDLKQAVKFVKESYTAQEACLKIQQRFSRNIGSSQLKLLFKQKNLGDLNALLLTKAVERVEWVESNSRLKREHKDLVEEVRDFRERQKVLDALNKAPKIERIKRREKSNRREGCAVVLASDWHVEEHVPARADTVSNYYDLAVAKTRADRFFAGVDSLIQVNRPTFGVRDLVLWLGGDLMTGYLRNENREENELSPVETINWLRTRLTAGIDYLLENSGLEQITIVCSHGNHGRTTEKRQISTGAKNSFEWLLYQWVAQYYADNKAVRVITDQSNHQYLDVYDFSLHFHHGDEVKYGGGIGGISVPLMKAVHRWNAIRHSHYHHVGHFHQYTDFGNVTINGSLIGYNAYAMSIGARPEPAQQAFYILDSKRGKTASYPIWVTE